MLSSGARAWISIQAAGASTALSWPIKLYPVEQERQSVNFTAQLFAEDQIPSKATNPERPSPIPPTLVVVAGVERRDTKEHALLALDSVDLAALRQ